MQTQTSNKFFYVRGGSTSLSSLKLFSTYTYKRVIQYMNARYKLQKLDMNSFLVIFKTDYPKLAHACFEQSHQDVNV